MPDRTDPSQYNTAPAGENVKSFYGNVSVDNYGIVQTPQENGYATTDEFGDFRDPAEHPDYLQDNPGAYFTAISGVISQVGTYRPLPVGSGIVQMGPGYLAGFSVYAIAGPLAVLLHDGNDANSPIIAVMTGGTSWFLPGGIRYFNGLYAELVSGTYRGSVLIRTDVHA
jgi:hypothetical protein